MEPEEQPPPSLADETRWYTEHTALLISTVKWALLGAAAGLCVGFGTRAFLWTLSASGTWMRRVTPGGVHPVWLLPLALPACVLLVRTFAPSARGHGTEAVIAAVHRDSGRIPWKVAPIKLLATVVTLAFGGSVGKEGPCAQIGAAIASLFADVLRLNDEDRRRLVICGIGGGFAAVFGTPISGAIFGIEVLYLGRIEYAVLFPCLVSGIVAHLVCGVQAPVPALHEGLGGLGRTELVGLSIVFGAVFGIVALVLIEGMRGLDRLLRRFERHPYLVAAAGGVFLAAFYAVVGDAYAGLGVATIESALAATGTIAVLAFLWKIVATAVTLETGGSGGIVTPLFFIGATSGAALARLLHLPTGLFAAFGFVSVVAGAANTPIAAAVMGIELLPREVGVYAALAAGTAFLLVGHRSVYASQKIGLSKSAGLDVRMDVPIGDLTRSEVQIRPGSLAERVHRISTSRGAAEEKSEPGKLERTKRIQASVSVSPCEGRLMYSADSPDDPIRREALRAELGLPTDATDDEIRASLRHRQGERTFDQATFDRRVASRIELLSSRRENDEDRLPLGAHVLVSLSGAVLVLLAIDASWTFWLRVPLGLLGLMSVVVSTREVTRRWKRL